MSHPQLMGIKKTREGRAVIRKLRKDQKGAVLAEFVIAVVPLLIGRRLRMIVGREDAHQAAAECLRQPG